MQQLQQTTDIQHRRDLLGTDLLFSCRVNHFTDFNMACLKSLTGSTNQPYRKAYSFSEEISTPQRNCDFFSRKSHSSPFESYQRRLDSIPLLPFLKPTKSSRDLFGCEGCQLDINMDNMLQKLKNCIDSMHVKTTDCTVAAPAVNEMPSCTQHSLLDNAAASQPVNFSVLDNINSLTSATVNNTYNCAVLKETMQDNNTKTPVASFSTGETNFASCSISNVTEESNQATEMSSHCECLCYLSVDKCCLHESDCSNSDTQNCKNIADSKPTMDDSTSQCALKPILNLTSVLSAPRKTVKKGRPSSKKQKKRQREKQKHGSQLLQTKDILGSTHTGCDTKQRLPSQSMKLTCNQSSEFDISPKQPCNPAKFEAAHEASTSGKAFSTCPLKRFFVSLVSYSEDENSLEDDNDDHDSNDYSIGKHKEVHFSPIKGFGFNCALDLDTIFKKTIPDQKNVFSAEKKTADFRKNGCRSSLDQDRFNNSSAKSASPALKDVGSCFFTPALSLDILFCKKSTSNSQAAADLKETTFDLVDDFSSDEENINHLSNGNETVSETLEKMNALWNENYPTAGFRSCSSVSADDIKHPTIKVHFAAEPDLLTVHIVDAEERNGNWHHVIREREHFESRMLELKQILCPFLEASHRAKVLEHRSQEQQ